LEKGVDLYKKSPKRYQKKLKFAAGLQPKAKDQPNLATIRDPNTNEFTAESRYILTVLQTHFEKEHSRKTPEHILLPPWQNSLNPDPYTTPRKGKQNVSQHTLDYYLTRGHYAAACHKASAGKAPGPDTVPNEILKYLTESAHVLIFKLFQIMAKHSYTPKKWCTSATKLI